MSESYFKSQDLRFSVRISSDVLSEVLSLCVKTKRKETGGILVGRYGEGNSCAYITKISGPGSGSVHGSFSFFRAIGQLQNWLDGLWRDKDSYYLGEWHFHPFSSPQPSSTDLKQMQYIARNEKNACPEPILIIIGGDPQGDWLLHVKIFTKDGQIIDLTASE